MKPISTERLLTLGMALYADKRTMEQRVRGIFGRKRSTLFARVLAVILCLLVGVIGFTTACIPVTEEAAGGVAALMENPSAVTPVRYDVEEDFTTEDGGVQFHIRAVLDAPSGPMTVRSIAPRALTMPEIRTITETLFAGNTAYARDTCLNRQYIEKAIMDTRAHIADYDALVAYYDGNAATADAVQAEFTQRIAGYEAILPEAPEAVARYSVETDWTFRPYGYYEDAVLFAPAMDTVDPALPEYRAMFADTQAFIAETMIDGLHAAVEAVNFASGASVTFNLGSEMSGRGFPVANPQADAPANGMREADALAIAEETVRRLGVTGMRMTECITDTFDVSTGEPANPDGPSSGTGHTAMACIIQYRRDYDGASVATHLQAPPERTEHLRLHIANGRVYRMVWGDASAVRETREEAPALISADEALSRNRAWLQGTYAGGKGTMGVTRVALEYFPVSEDASGVTTLTPAWSFYGTMTMTKDGMRRTTDTVCLHRIDAVSGETIDAFEWPYRAKE